MRKKSLSPLIILVLALSVFTALNLNITGVSAGKFPAIYIDPASTNNTGLTPGNSYTVSIKTNSTSNEITSFQFALAYNPVVLNVIEVTAEGCLISNDTIAGMGRFEQGTINNTLGELTVTSAYFLNLSDPKSPPTTTGPGTLANVTFTVVGTGESDIVLGDETILYGWDGLVEYDIIDAATEPDHIQNGYFRNVDPAPAHDLNVTSVVPPTSVLAPASADIDVTIKNEGDVNETFSVEVYYDQPIPEYLFGTAFVENLPNGDDTTITVACDTTYVSNGSHPIIAKAGPAPIPIPREADLTDNTMTSTANLTVVSPYIAVVPETTINPDLTTYTVSIYTDYSYTSDVRKYEFTLTYNGSILNGDSVVNGDLVTPGTFTPGSFNDAAGTLSLTTCTGTTDSTGPGTLANVTFTVVATGESDIVLGPETRLIRQDGSNITMPHRLYDGYFTNFGDAAAIAIYSPRHYITGETVTDAYDPWLVDITVTVQNVWGAPSFRVEVYAGENWIAKSPVSGATQGVDLNMTLSCFLYPGGHFYTISAKAILEGDHNTTNDQVYYGMLRVRVTGNVDGDGDVDVGDQRKQALAMFTSYADPGTKATYVYWNTHPYYTDVDGDGDVDVGDQRKQALHMFEIDWTGK